MAAKRPSSRNEKSVLSRQDIVERRRALSQKKLQTGGAGRRALAGVLVITASLLTLLGLGTYNVKDRIGPGFKNAVGPAGHALAELLKGALGVCAYTVPIAGLYLAGVLFVGTKEKRRWPLVVAGVMLLVSFAVLFQIAMGTDAKAPFPPGGALGAGLAETLGGALSVAGTVIVMAGVAVAALIIGTQMAFLKACTVAWTGVLTVAARAEQTLGALWVAQKAAFGKRREVQALAKLEEAAFLAQLESDEEELEAAERDVEEAEAVADEAYRLQKEAEGREAAKLEQRTAKDRARTERISKRLDGAPSLPSGEPGGATDSLAPGDPAWATALTVGPTAAAPASAVAVREKRVPNVVTAPSLGSASLSQLAPAADVQAAPFVDVTKSAVTPPGLVLARTPLIIEPKAPPKPTLPLKREEFQFAAGHTRFTLPPMDVLECDKVERTAIDKDAFLSTAEKLRAKLADFGIVGEVVEIRPGPVVTMYEFLPGPGIKISKIASLSDDLAMAMEAMRVRIVAPIPGKGVVGIEVPNRDRETVFLKEIVEQDIFQKSASKITMAIGKDIEGMPYVLDLAKAPHLLIAGTTGSGKSVAVNAMIMSILLKSTPEEVRFIMVDPKMLELSVYEGIPHLLLPVVTDPKKAALALRWAVEEMERRYHLLSAAGVRNISGYNKLIDAAPAVVADTGGLLAKKALAAKKLKAKSLLIVDVAGGESEDAALERARAEQFGVAAPRDDEEDVREGRAEAPADEVVEGEVTSLSAEQEELEFDGEEKKEAPKKLPFIVVIIDELADLMMVASREVETYIARLAQMARASGIHLMVATQRPSTDVVTGVIKANFPTRISFMLRTKPDSMTILGTVGSEALLGMGDMLIMPPTSAHLQRVHGAYVSEQEIKRAVDHLKAQGKPVYDDSILKAREEDGEGGGGQDDELSDELWDQALATVGEMRQVSISMLQRKMRIGYNRAARMVERMERDGIVGPADGAKPREVLLRAGGTEMPGAGAM